MSKEPEALRLAEGAPYLEGGERGQWIMSAADELRRLHENNQELLEALKHAAEHAYWTDIEQQLYAAIAKAEGETNEF